MLKFLSYLVLVLLMIGLILTSTGFVKKTGKNEFVKIKEIKNGYNTVSINQLDSLSAASNIYFSRLVR
jgi:hypothetical protein